MERAAVFSLILMACAFPTGARADCLPRAPQVVTLSGKVEERPPASRADERVTANPRPRRVGVVLLLAEPICVAGAAADKGEEAVTEIGLVFGDKALSAIPTGTLQVTGSLTRALVANGSPRVVMVVRRINPAPTKSP